MAGKLRRATAVVADDEPALRRHLERLLEELWPEAQVVASVGDGVSALAALREHSPDVAFLDIRMPGMSGLEVAKRHSAQKNDTAIVFVTAFDEHALEAFERSAVDYLVKPATVGRLSETIERLRQRTSSSLSKEMLDSIAQQLAKTGSHLRWLRVGLGETVQFVDVNQVQFFRADQKYTSAFTEDAEHLVKLSVTDLSARLDPDCFWRIHRGTIINVSAIASASRDFRGRYRLTLKNRPESLTVSATYAHLFRRM